MACRLLGAKPLSKPMLDYWQLDPLEQISVKLQSKYTTFRSRKCIWKYCLWNGTLWQPFCPGGEELKLTSESLPETMQTYYRLSLPLGINFSECWIKIQNSPLKNPFENIFCKMYTMLNQINWIDTIIHRWLEFNSCLGQVMIIYVKKARIPQGTNFLKS